MWDMGEFKQKNVTSVEEGRELGGDRDDLELAIARQILSKHVEVKFYGLLHVSLQLET